MNGKYVCAMTDTILCSYCHNLLIQFYTAKRSSPIAEMPTAEGAPLALLRFQSGPKAEQLAPYAGDRGYLQLQVRWIDVGFL